MPKRPMMSDRKAETTRVAPRADAALLGRERERREVVELLVREVMPNRRQPRQRFDEASLAELADSIRLHGVLEPVIVRAIPLTLYEGGGRQYELIAGERRWRAAQLAGLPAVPALVLPETTSDQAALELAITENLQREDLHPLDEAAAFGRMQSELGLSFAQIAERLGKSRGYVQNRLRLLQLDADLRELVRERPDTLVHVTELAKLPPPARASLVEMARSGELSFPETRARVQALLQPPAPLAEPAPQPEAPATLGQAAPPLLPARAPASPPGKDAALAGLSGRERSALASTVQRISQLQTQPDALGDEDWSLLEALAEQLAALLIQRRTS